MDDKFGLVLFGFAAACVVVLAIDALIRWRQKDAPPKVMRTRRVLFFAGLTLTATAGGIYGVNPMALPHHLLLIVATVLSTLTVMAFIFAMVRKDRS